ncbi:MAG TPA: hypothetical protein VG033_12200 [Candidatus Acidoferrales bacterium]|jgi:hypothetical protein|nr:hypothetical protein [Candidatus Acidoferrales bacterium]
MDTVRRNGLVLVAAGALLAFGATCPRAQEAKPPQSSDSLPRGKKLILKDGTIQLVSSYEVQGERVRFYSIERSDWEEMPAGLVDWDATKKAEAEQAKKDQALLAKVRTTEVREHYQPIVVDASIEVAPGKFLPPGVGAYMVDGKAVLPLEQAPANVKLDKARLLEQVMSPIPIVPSRKNVQLTGNRAKLRIRNGEPEFYMRTADEREPQLELVRAKVHGNWRIVEHLDSYRSEHSEQRDTVAVQRWEVAKGVYRLTLSQALEPGEYALAEIVVGEGMNLYLWDFGIDAAAPVAPQKVK